MQLAAKLAEMPVEDFIALNPGFSRPLIRASVAPRIVLPADKVDVFHDNLAKYDEKSLVSWEVYRPKRGESLLAIAKKYRRQRRRPEAGERHSSALLEDAAGAGGADER